MPGVLQAAELAEFEGRREAESSAELDKWKGLFSVEGGGSVEEDVAEQTQGLLQGFVDYIKVLVYIGWGTRGCGGGGGWF